MDRNSLKAKCKTVACPGQEKPQNTDSQGWEGRCAGEVLNQDRLESWLELFSQMPASRAVEAEVHPVRHCGGPWHISDHLCSPKSSSGLPQCDGCCVPGSSSVKAPMSQGARVSGGRLRDQMNCG